jgi:all-trans-nonaprenyl-diphosphate synthase
MNFLTENIARLIDTKHPMLKTVASYYFSAQGKKMRPLAVMLMASATGRVQDGHYTLAMITEMIHTASLLHDDVIDNADVRRGIASAPSEFGNKMAILAGDFLLGRAAVALAGLKDIHVFASVAQVIGDLVQGEVWLFVARDWN